MVVKRPFDSTIPPTVHVIDRCGVRLELYCYAPHPPRPLKAHWHESLQVSFSPNARFFGDVRTGRQAIDEGSTWVVPAGQAHGSDNQNAHMRSLRYTTLFFSSQAITRQLGVDAHEAQAGFEFAVYKSPLLTSAIRSLAAHMVDHLDDAIVDSAASHLLMQIRCTKTRCDARSGSDSEPLVMRLREFIHANLSKRLTLEDIQAQSDRSLTATRECFRLITGMPIHAYIMAARAERARQLMGPSSDLSEIAFRVGLSDQSHLNRLFKNFFAITPGQYRSGS